MYAPFESGQLTGSADVYSHEIPGGQYTNLYFQSRQLGLAGQFGAVKRAYASANRLLGDIVKVTPSSKVVGDLAQFMVANRLSEAAVTAQAASLSFPSSVVEYMQGYLGVPPGGFPEPFRTAVLGGRTLPNGKPCFEGRPGAELPPMDLNGVKNKLVEVYGECIRPQDVLSSVMYPASFAEWMRVSGEMGNLSVIPTSYFAAPMAIGEEISFELVRGKTLYVRLTGVSEVDDGGMRTIDWLTRWGEPAAQIATTDSARGGMEFKAMGELKWLLMLSDQARVAKRCRRWRQGSFW